MGTTNKRLRIFAGPNGSGKSVLYQFLIEARYFEPYFYINSDEIANELPTGFSVINWPVRITQENLLEYFKASSFLPYFGEIRISDVIHVEHDVIRYCDKLSSIPVSYLAAAIADFLRQSMVRADSSFSVETVFSHVSKLQFITDAKSAGFKVYFYFISTEDPGINLQRVENRVALGGHDVPVDKIDSRYYRCMENAFEAFRLSDRVFFFDNSGSTQADGFSAFAEKNEGELYIHSQTVPVWFDRYILKKMHMGTLKNNGF